MKTTIHTLLILSVMAAFQAVAHGQMAVSTDKFMIGVGIKKNAVVTEREDSIFTATNDARASASILSRFFPNASGESRRVFEGFSISPRDIVLAKDKDFTGKATISGISDSDLQKVTKSDCATLCTITILGNEITFTLNKASVFNAQEINKSIVFVYKKGEEGETSASVRLKVPPRITGVSTKIQLDRKEVKSLVEGQTANVEVSYVLDGATERSTAFMLFPSDKTVEVKNDAITAKQTGSATIIVRREEDKTNKIQEISIKVLPAINSIAAKGGASIYMTESSDAEIKLEVKGTNDATLNTERVECAPTENGKPLSLIKTTTGYTLKSLPLPIDPSNRKAISNDTVTIRCTVVNQTAFDKATSLDVNVFIQQRTGSIVVDSLNGNTLLPNGTLTFIATVFDTAGAEISAPIRFSLENPPKDKQWVTLSQQGKKLIVTWVDFAEPDAENPKEKNKRPDFVNINVEAFIGGSNQPVTTKITVHMASVARFSSLKVKLNVMDDRTASDLYGEVLKNEYYVLLVRLFNDLPGDDANGSRGESILAYSSSIEIAVGIEKQFNKDLNSGTMGSLSSKQLNEIEKARSRKLLNDFNSNLATLDDMYKEYLDEFNERMREAFDKDSIAIEMEVQAKTNRARAREAAQARADADAAYKVAAAIADKLRNLYRLNALSTPKVPPPDADLRNGKWYPASRDELIEASAVEERLLSAEEAREDYNSPKSLDDGEPNCQDTITYKPFTFEMMINTVDRRDERSLRSKIFKILNFAGLGLSSVTAVAVPSKGSDLPLGIEKYGNLVIPGLEKLFPTLKEQNRQNIVSQAMKPIEEIPFGSDITRVVFIPKKSIQGLVTGHNVRISQICPYYFKIKVAVVSKGGQVTLRAPRL